jgi:hypothetical protein
MSDFEDEDDIDTLKEEIEELKKENRMMYEKYELKKYEEDNEAGHTCYYEDDEGNKYPEPDAECDVCLQIYRMKRYGVDTHDVRCVC